MKIYKIERNYDYQYFLPDSCNYDSPNAFGKPFLPEWKSPEFYIREPNLKQGNFYHWLSWVLIADTKAAGMLQDLLEMSGELHKFVYNNEKFTLLNPLHTFNLLDESNTVWQRHFKTGNKTEVIEKYAFVSHRIGEEPIFKIPEQRAYLFTVEGVKNPDDEFKPRVEKAGLTGLNFIEVWSDG